MYRTFFHVNSLITVGKGIEEKTIVTCMIACRNRKDCTKI